MTLGILYFVLMETLQYFQYMWINQCDNPINQFLTVVGFAHICFQPYFTHLMNFSMFRSPEKRTIANTVSKLCIIQGVYMFSRYIFVDMEKLDLQCASHDWISGNRVCTYLGNHHLAWQLPLRTGTYFWPTNNIHFFMMYAPFLLVNWLSVIPGVLLFLSGPYLSTWITDNLHEQASIWCFFSICQISLLVLYARCNGKASGAWATPEQRAATMAAKEKQGKKKAM